MQIHNLYTQRQAGGEITYGVQMICSVVVDVSLELLFGDRERLLRLLSHII